MFSCGREMFRYFFIALLIFPCLLSAEAVTNGRTRGRRPAAINSDKQESAAEKLETVPDQLAQATIQSETNNQRRAGAYGNEADENYPYGNLEMNLIRPESEAPVHTRITAKYRFSAKRQQEDIGSLEDAETAEEYVSKAMQKNLFGSRLREPINIPAQSESTTAENNNNAEQNANYNERANAYNYLDVKQQNEQQQQQVQQQQSAQQHEREQTQQEQNVKSLLEAQILAANQAYDAHNEQMHGDNAPQQPAPVYEKDTTGYDNSQIDDTNAQAQPVDRQYRTKYVYQPYRGTEDRVRYVEDKLRVSASTEIPRAEIMKQIEKSVMKYMKELEAEGKIITAPQQEQNSYYQLVTGPTEEKTISSSTSRPKLMTTTTSYHGTRPASMQKQPVAYHQGAKNQGKMHYQSENENRYQQAQQQQQQAHHQQQQSQQQQQQTQQTQVADVADAMAPNVEFIYKIKTRAPLQTATVKTVSKPYTLPLKASNYEHFDHSAALKNLEEFDLSHVVTTDEHEEKSGGRKKPNKLYFNSEIYHDINSLPFKAEKAIAMSEYRKLKSNAYHTDYKGYNSGYFAEPTAAHADREQSEESTQLDSDDGYPLNNPYKYVLKKEALPTGLEDPHAVANWEQQRVHSSKLYPSSQAQKALEYDSYNPRFNNNPEGYGYQHSIKSILTSGEREHVNPKYLTRHTLVKRGKRGNSHAHASKKVVRSSVKDVEANIALRPPPKS